MIKHVTIKTHLKLLITKEQVFLNLNIKVSFGFDFLVWYTLKIFKV